MATSTFICEGHRDGAWENTDGFSAPVTPAPHLHTDTLKNTEMETHTCTFCRNRLWTQVSKLNVMYEQVITPRVCQGGHLQVDFGSQNAARHAGRWRPQLCCSSRGAEPGKSIGTGGSRGGSQERRPRVFSVPNGRWRAQGADPVVPVANLVLCFSPSLWF